MSSSRAAVAYWLARDARAVTSAQELDASALHALSIHRLRALLAAAARAPFYAERMHAAGLRTAHAMPDVELAASLSALAPVSKQDLRGAGSAALRDGQLSSAWPSSMSSGSSGEPFRVYYDARAWATLKHLVKIRSRRAVGLQLTDRMAILDAIAPEREGASPLERAGRVRRISVFRANAEIAEALARFRPRGMYALPSALLEVARAMDDGAPRMVVPRIFTSGELLTGAARHTIERAFGARVYDVYGTSETKEIAWECAHGSRHINADVVRVEILGDQGLAAPAGAEGEIVVTLLVNEAMPLVRYRTGDRGALAEGKCACGRASPLLGVVSGREADVLELPDGSTRSPYKLTTALERVAGLVGYQVVQTARDTLRATAIAERGADPDRVVRDVALALRAELPLDVRIDVVPGDALPRGARAKVRAVHALPRSSDPADELTATSASAS